MVYTLALSLFDIRYQMDGSDRLSNSNSKPIRFKDGHSFAWTDFAFFRSSPIKNTHYACLKLTAANGMIAFPNQCGTIRLIEAKTLKEYIQNSLNIL